jgi:hypothetical protein
MQGAFNSIKSTRVRNPTVAVVHEDLTVGYRYADWFAARGYQATVTPLQRLTEGPMRELSPDLIIVGMPMVADVGSHAVARLRRFCPCAAIVAMVQKSPTSAAANMAGTFAGALGADVFMCRSLEPDAGPHS